jgi:3-hydroxymyristoyl/3-hydroxydecanoyl-(acyl carrier protein) dehydratase
MKLPPVLGLETISTDEINIQLAVTANDEAFAGHFPDYPILPGVVQVDWALRFAKLHLGIASAGQNFQVKFHNVIQPGMSLSLNLQFKRAKNRLTFAYHSEGKAMSSGQFKLDAQLDVAP